MRRRAAPTACCCAAALPASRSAPARRGPPVVLPGLGRLEGVWDGAEGASARSWLGVPYAAPPVGDLRWRPPLPAPGWGGTRRADWFGDACFGSGAGWLPESEDCLYLNVFAPPPHRGASPLPVMVWIHGGGYTTGTGANAGGPPLVSGSGDALIVVAVNYRLNAFGFLGTPVMARRTNGSFGNFGIEDQRLALLWVQQHIAQFGGDPARVTIFGDSAGGNSVLTHLVQRPSFGLYQRAIVESGAYKGGVTVEDAGRLYDRVLTASGCDSLDCLLALPPDKVVVPTPTGWHDQVTWGPVIDGVLMTRQPTQVIHEGGHNTHAEVLLGSNRDEHGFFLIALNEPDDMDEAGFDIDVTKEGDIPGGVPRELLAELKHLYSLEGSYPYPTHRQGAGRNFSSWWWMAMRVQTDKLTGVGHCSARMVAHALSRHQRTFLYMFAHPGPQQDWPGLIGSGEGTAISPHGAEIPFIFGCGLPSVPSRAPVPPAGHPWCPPRPAAPGGPTCWSPGEPDLSKQVMRYWARFASSGDPNGAGLPHWPAFGGGDGDVAMRMQVAGDGGSAPHWGVRAQACDWWDAHAGRPW